MRSFFYNLDKAIDESNYLKNYELRNFYYDVRDFILKGTFTRYKKVNQILDYWGESDSYVSKMTGMKESTVRVTRRNLSKELYELFGYDFFNLVSQGTDEAIEKGRVRLSLADKNICADTFIYREIIDTIKRKSTGNENIDIDSCIFEIQFLMKHSKGTVEKEMSMLDMDKLAYIIKMLDNEVDTFPNIIKLVQQFERN